MKYIVSILKYIICIKHIYSVFYGLNKIKIYIQNKISKLFQKTFIDV